MRNFAYRITQPHLTVVLPVQLTAAQRALREKWALLPPCPYGCGGKLFGNVCSNDCPPMRQTIRCGEAS